MTKTMPKMRAFLADHNSKMKKSRSWRSASSLTAWLFGNEDEEDVMELTDEDEDEELLLGKNSDWINCRNLISLHMLLSLQIISKRAMKAMAMATALQISSLWRTSRNLLLRAGEDATDGDVTPMSYSKELLRLLITMRTMMSWTISPLRSEAQIDVFKVKRIHNFLFKVIIVDDRFHGRRACVRLTLQRSNREEDLLQLE